LNNELIKNFTKENPFDSTENVNNWSPIEVSSFDVEFIEFLSESV